MRHVGDASQLTPFGHFIREYCKGSGRRTGEGLSVTNLDFVIEDYINRRLMLLEEKQHNGSLHNAQCKTFRVLDAALRAACEQMGYAYWGFYVLRMPGTMPGPGMTLNESPITSEQLVSHLNFEKRHCHPLFVEPRVVFGKASN